MRPIDSKTWYAAFYKDLPTNHLEEVKYEIQIEKKIHYDYVKSIEMLENKAIYAAGALDWINSLESTEERLLKQNYSTC